LRTPLGLEKHISLEYIEVALGLVGVDVSGLVGWMSKGKCWRMGLKCPRGSIAKRSRIMFLSRIQAIGQKEESQPEAKEWAKVRQTCVFPGLSYNSGWLSRKRDARSMSGLMSRIDMSA
jgi:hypothetical protein